MITSPYLHDNLDPFSDSLFQPHLVSVASPGHDETDSYRLFGIGRVLTDPVCWALINTPRLKTILVLKARTFVPLGQRSQGASRLENDKREWVASVIGMKCLSATKQSPSSWLA